MKGKRILVTGGAGFIGSNIVENLKDDNEIVVIDNFSTSNPLSTEFIRNSDIELVEGSITDYKLVESVLEDVEYILHQAAVPSVSRSVKDPLVSNEANITGTLTLLQASAQSNIERFVMASSSSVYGDVKELPKVESMRLNPKSPYAVTKMVCEHYCRVFNEIYGLKTVVLRYFNVYGPMQNPTGEYSAVIPKFIHNALENSPLVIYGDGTQTRDFTYVKDVVDANISVCQKTSAVGEVFNIARGEQATINELANTIIRLTKSKSKIEHVEERRGDVRDSLAGTEKAKRMINWEAERSLEEGLKMILKKW